MKIPVDKVEISDVDLIRKALPKGYWLGKRGDERIVFRGELGLAKAFIAEGMISFEFFTFKNVAWAVEALQADLVEKWSDYDPDTILWKVIFATRNFGWAYAAGPEYKTREDAMIELRDFMFNNKALLCAYRRGDWTNEGMTTTNTYQMTSFNTSGPDLGPTKIDFNGLVYSLNQ